MVSAADLNSPLEALADRTAWLRGRIAGLVPDVQAFYAPGKTEWIKPADAKFVEIVAVGSGGGGGTGSGMGSAGGGGGGAGAVVRRTLPAALCPDTLIVTVAAGGAADTYGDSSWVRWPDEGAPAELALYAAGGTEGGSTIDGSAGGAGATGGTGDHDGGSGGNGGAAGSGGHAGTEGYSGGAGVAGADTEGGQPGPGRGAGGGGGSSATLGGGGGGGGGYGIGFVALAGSSSDGTGGTGAPGVVIITTWRGIVDP